MSSNTHASSPKSHFVHTVAVSASPFGPALAGTTPWPATLSDHVTPTVDRLYTLTPDAASMSNSWLWHEFVSRHACP